jgi:hypothetical protein
MSDDAAYIARVVERLADQEKNVLLIAHSYSGVPTTESVKGLSKNERKKNGKKGGIVHLGYITALVPEVGQSASGVLADGPAAPQGVYTSDVSILHNIFRELRLMRDRNWVGYPRATLS